MMVKTYLKNHPDIKEFWIMASEFDYCLCKTDNQDQMDMFGSRKIKEIEPSPEPGELITLHI